MFSDERDRIWQALPTAAFDANVLDIARRLKPRHFDGRVFAVVPVYITSIRGEECVYGNFRSGNQGRNVERLRLMDENLERAAAAALE
jgi:hypothetical protein